jgi:hypothetical protein
VTLLEPGEAGTSLFTAGAAFGYVFGPACKVVVVGQLPIAGEHRFDAKLGLNVYVYF